MHMFFVKGVFNISAYLTFNAIKTDGVTDIYERLMEYVALWKLPQKLGSCTSLAKIFSKKREAACHAAKAFKCQASEGVSVIPIIAYCLQKVIMRAGIAVSACAAFVALADLVDTVSLAYSGSTTAEFLRFKVNTFLDACVAAGWEPYMTPKFHWPIHLPKQLEQWRFLLSCYVHERKHRMVKRYSTSISNTARNEWSVLSEVTCHHLATLRTTKSFDSRVGLLPPMRSAPQKLHRFCMQQTGVDAPCTTARSARINELHVCHTRDVVLVKTGDGEMNAAQVWFHAEMQGQAFSLVAVWELLRDEGELCAKVWRTSNDRLTLCLLGDIVAPCTYKLQGRVAITLDLPTAR